MSITVLPPRSRRGRRRRVAVAVGSTALIVLVSSVVAAPVLAAAPAHSSGSAVARADDDEVVLPTRVGAAIDRARAAVERTETAIDDGDGAAARKATGALVDNLRRAHRAGIAQMNAVPVDPEAETTPGPDSVIAVLTLEQLVVARIANLYDGLSAPRVVAALSKASRRAAVLRTTMLDAVTALDPEGAGADYADGMADTVDGYTDEVATLQEALDADRLTPPARKALTATLSRSLATQSAVVAAFGGGE